MIRLAIATTATLLAAAAPAWADRVAADRCAAGLPPGSHAIYAQSLPAVLRGDTIKDAVTASARSMVMNGGMPRGDARPAAEAAGRCLMLLR